MKREDVRITIDQNGQIHREIIEQPEPEKRPPSLLKRISSALSVQVVADEKNR